MARSDRSFWPGIILLVLGVLFLLDNLEVASFSHLITTYWPLILILVGISILLRATRFPSQTASSLGRGEFTRPPEQPFSTTAPQAGASFVASSDIISQTSVFGNISIKPVSKNFKGGALSAIFGNIDLNLTSAELAEGEHHLGLNGVFGSIHVTLPKDMAVSVRSNCLFGNLKVLDQTRGGIGSEIVYKSENYDSSTRKLNINASQVLGDIKIW